MLNMFLSIIFVIFIIPTIIFWTVLIWHCFWRAYYATQVTLFKLRVILHVRKQSENYKYLDSIFKLPFLLIRTWLVTFRLMDKVCYVQTKAKRTTYYFNGWNRPIVDKSSEY